MKPEDFGDEKTGRILREDVRQRLATLSVARIAAIAAMLREESPDDEALLRKLYRRPNWDEAESERALGGKRFEAPDSANEADVWPQVVRRQAYLAIEGDARLSASAAVFLGRLWGKLRTDEDGGGRKGRGGEKALSDDEIVARAQQILVARASVLDHEPGAATVVDSGIETPARNGRAR